MTMSGRETFKRYSFLLNLMVGVFKITPKFIKIFLWDAIKPYSQLPFIALRYVILKTLCLECGSNIRIGSNVTLLNLKGVILGSNISIHDNCYIDGAGSLIIKDNVSIAHNSSILTTNHSWGDILSPIKYNPVELEKVIVNEDVWIGCACRILAGVEIGSRSIIASGAIVNKNVPSNSIYAGVPAKFLKEI